MGEDDQHHGHLVHGRGRPAPRSPRPWARTTSTTVTSPMGEDDQHHGTVSVPTRGAASLRDLFPSVEINSTDKEGIADISAELVQRRVGQDSQDPKPDPTPNNGHTAFRLVSIGFSVEILRQKQVGSTNQDCPHQLAVWQPGSPLELLSPVSIVQLSVSSQSDFPLRFYDENKSARRIETVRISSPCGKLRGLIQLALRRPGSPLKLLSPVSIVQLFLLS
ncbi:hypothetical protein Bca101_036738 [Brassica carinata]